MRTKPNNANADDQFISLQPFKQVNNNQQAINIDKQDSKNIDTKHNGSDEMQEIKSIKTDTTTLIGLYILSTPS